MWDVVRVIKRISDQSLQRVIKKSAFAMGEKYLLVHIVYENGVEMDPWMVA